jgi:hypothetical protein
MQRRGRDTETTDGMPCNYGANGFQQKTECANAQKHYFGCKGSNCRVVPGSPLRLGSFIPKYRCVRPVNPNPKPLPTIIGPGE